MKLKKGQEVFQVSIGFAGWKRAVFVIERVIERVEGNIAFFEDRGNELSYGVSCPVAWELIHGDRKGAMEFIKTRLAGLSLKVISGEFSDEDGLTYILNGG